MKWKLIFKCIAETVFVICSITSMISLAIILKYERVYVGSQYSLEDLEDGQAVMGITLPVSGEVIVIDRSGRWKCGSLEVFEDLTDFDLVEAFDSILQDENIPYQEKKSGIGKPMLVKAINLSDFELRKQSENSLDSEEISYYAIAVSGKQRHQILIGRGRITQDIKWDINLLRMRLCLKRLSLCVRQKRELTCLPRGAILYNVRFEK